MKLSDFCTFSHSINSVFFECSPQFHRNPPHKNHLIRAYYRPKKPIIANGVNVENEHCKSASNPHLLSECCLCVVLKFLNAKNQIIRHELRIFSTHFKSIKLRFVASRSFGTVGVYLLLYRNFQAPISYPRTSKHQVYF